MARTPAERSTHARIAAHTRWSDEPDRTAATASARAAGPGSIEYWIRQVDPEGNLDRATVVPMAESKKKVFFERLALAGRRAKAAKREAGQSKSTRRTRSPRSTA